MGIVNRRQHLLVYYKLSHGGTSLPSQFKHHLTARPLSTMEYKKYENTIFIYL